LTYGIVLGFTSQKKSLKIRYQKVNQNP